MSFAYQLTDSDKDGVDDRWDQCLDKSESIVIKILSENKTSERKIFINSKIGKLVLEPDKSIAEIIYSISSSVIFDSKSSISYFIDSFSFNSPFSMRICLDSNQ